MLIIGRPKRGGLIFVGLTLYLTQPQDSVNILTKSELYRSRGYDLRQKTNTQLRLAKQWRFEL